jgi:hypothetical protein
MVSMSNQWHGGKGSAPRKNDNKKLYEENWEKIFGNKDKPKEKPTLEEEIDKS